MRASAMTRRAQISWMVAGIVAAAVIPYANVATDQWVYDDHAIIEGSPPIHPPADVRRILTSDTWLAANRQPSGLYRPLASLSFALDWAAAGPKPAWFRFENVFWHALVCLVLFAALRRFGAGDRASFATAMLFAVHPLHTEAVTWPVGRAELIAALFFFAAWLVHLRSPGADLRTGLATGTLYLLAMTGKESAAVLPAVLVLSDLLRPPDASALPRPQGAPDRSRPAPPDLRRKAPPGSTPALRRGARWWTLRYGPVAAALALFVLARWEAVGRWVPPDVQKTINPLAPLPIPGRVAGALSVLGRYFLLMLWPADLSVDYSYRAFPIPASFFDPRVLAVLAAAAASLAVAVAARRRWPALSLGLIFPWIAFLLTSNLLFPIGTVMAERLAYLPSAGLCLVAGWGIARAAEGASRVRSPLRHAAAAALVLAVVACASRTWARNAKWSDDVTLFSDAVRVVPDSWYAHFALASVQVRRGDDQGALVSFREILRIAPQTPEMHNEIGDILRRHGDLAGAEAELRMETLVNPASARAPYNLGFVHLARGRRDLAKESFALAATKDPGNADILYNLGVLTMEDGALAEARSLFERAIAIEPANLNARLNLATACLDLGDQACARREAGAASAAGASLPPSLAALIR
jgi:protein O-mannosyl-transferase